MSKLYHGAFCDLLEKNTEVRWMLHATLGYLVAVHLELVTEAEKLPATIEIRSPLTRGELYVFREFNRHFDKKLNLFKEDYHAEAWFLVKCDLEGVEKALYKAVQPMQKATVISLLALAQIQVERLILQI